MGVHLGFVTLHVGLGTFRPVKEDEIEDHPMHSEFCIIPEETARIVNETKARLAVAEPKAEIHDRLTASHGDVALMEAGRLLGQPPKKFLARLEAEGVLFRERGVLHPYAEHLAAGRFRVRVMPVAVDDDGRDVTRVQTLVTPAGLQWLARRYPTQGAVVLQ